MQRRRAAPKEGLASTKERGAFADIKRSGREGAPHTSPAIGAQGPLEETRKSIQLTLMTSTPKQQ
jgi:hypothetical protein